MMKHSIRVFGSKVCEKTDGFYLQIYGQRSVLFYLMLRGTTPLFTPPKTDLWHCMTPKREMGSSGRSGVVMWGLSEMSPG